MNIFVLCTGRCGSVTFTKACQHITNYTCTHESRVSLLGEDRLNYPPNHIEVDNRLSWFLGRLDEVYGDEAFYVHLIRNRDEVAHSYNQRWHWEGAIMPAYGHGILMQPDISFNNKLAICQDYCDTVNSNIRLFLKDKRHQMEIHLERITEEFPEFYRRIGAQGNLEAALGEWETTYNQTAPSVSVIIPAYNAAATLQKTLDSLLAQTFSRWEAIVVDDESIDETAAIASSYAERDSRIRTLSQPHQGGGAARNTGISLAQFDWLVFLDSDDWLAPEHLEEMTGVIVANPALDGVQCGYAWLTTDGQIARNFLPLSGDLFPVLAGSSPLPPLTYVVRRSTVQSVGGFDISLRSAEDWDLWQRVARTGARFGTVNKVLGYYQMRPNSSSANGSQLFVDGLQTLIQGHSADPRVQNPDPIYAQGQPVEQLPVAKFYWICWTAGLVISYGEDAQPMLDALQQDLATDLDPCVVADLIFYAVVRRTCQAPSFWDNLWFKLEQPITKFLLALETKSLTPGLARRTLTHLERLVVQHSQASLPLSVGTTYAVRLEVTEPICDICTPELSERLYCVVECEGTQLGTLELPVCDGLVAGYVLKDAIAAEFAWVLLGRFFQRTVYQDLHIEQESTGLALWRGTLRLTEGLSEGEQFWIQAHDQVGWTIFLQEVWGHSDWSQEIFYDPQAAEHRRKEGKNNSQSPAEYSTEGCHVVEVSGELADVKVSGQFLNVVLTVGGIAIGVFTIPTESGIVSAGQLQVALTIESGFELCRAVVREGLLGRPPTDGVSLRERLAQAAAVRHTQDTSELEASVPGLAPGTASALSEVSRLSENMLLLGHRTQEAIGTSASRWAMLPKTASNELTNAALVAGEPLIQIPQKNQQPERVFYVPSLILHPFGNQQRTATSSPVSSQAGENSTNFCDRSYFETTLAKGPQRWIYDNSHEQTKYKQTLSLLPSKPIKRALELACAACQFTIQLAPPVGKLIAADMIQLFQREPRWHLPWQQLTPQVIQMEQPTPPPPMVAADVLWSGGQPKRLGAELAVVTERLPILMYHRIAPTGSPEVNRWRVTPQAFEEQLCYLRDSEFYSVTLEDWRKAMASRRPLTGRAVLITFDDGYLDFLTYAWPLLKQYGFSATVFLVADKVGQSNSWDRLYSEELPLLDWQQIRQLQAEGVEFGSHSASHHPLTSLTVAEVVREGARSRSILEQQLGFPIRSFAYPHGDFDPVLEHLIGACGYIFGLSCRSGRARFEDRLLALPRVEVMGSDRLQDFVGKLTS